VDDQPVEQIEQVESEESDCDDIWNDDEDETIIINRKKHITDFSSVIENSLKKMDNKSVVKQMINFSDLDRINMLITEINNINIPNTIVKLNDNNIFDIDIIIIDFKNNDELLDIIMNIKLNPDLYPFYPPKISFNVLFESNLQYLISELDYFRVDNWNPTNSLENMINQIIMILNESGKILATNYDDNNIKMIQILNELSVSTTIKPLIYTDKKINIKFVNLNLNLNGNTNKINDKRNGVGYGNNINHSKFNLNSYVSSIQSKNKIIKEILSQVNELLSKNIDIRIIKESCLLRFIDNYLKDIQLLELNNNQELYEEIIKTVKILMNNYNELISYEFNQTSINKIIISCKKVIDIYMSAYQDKLTLIEEQLLDLTKQKVIDDKQETDSNDYLTYVKSNCFELMDKFIKPMYIPLDNNSNKYCKNISRMAKEMASLKTNIIPSTGSNIFVKFNKENMANIKFAITGPKDTPYENGFFEFHLKLGDTYPTNCPSCHFQTTGGGKARFNPNLYNNGKVCLSLLGTWNGNESEKWNASTSSIYQLIISIQSLILCENPYFNEPGYESTFGTDNGMKNSKQYDMNIQKYTIQYAVIDQINNPPIEFKDNIIKHFSYKKQEIINTYDKWMETNKFLTNELRIELIKSLSKV